MERLIDKIIIHCTASPDDRPIGLKEINEWHKERGWTPYLNSAGMEVYCGYHIIICRSGLIQLARPDWVPGIHCEGHNATSLGIVWVGEDKPTEEQKRNLLMIVSDKMEVHGLDIKQVFGHHEFNSGKTCPNLDMDQFRSDVELFRVKGIYE